MKLFSLLIISALSVSQLVKAESNVLFDAKEQCKSRQTSTGIRYVPPCTMPDTEFAFTIAKDAAKNKALTVNFQCESLRPLSAEYQITQAQKVIMSGNLAPSSDAKNAISRFEINEANGDYRFNLVKINGLDGFQAMKPDCILSVDANKSISLPSLALEAKINIAIWDSSQNALDKKHNALFKAEVIDAKYLLETIINILTEISPALDTPLNNAVNQLSEVILTCTSNKCNTAAYDVIEKLHSSSEEALNTIKLRLDTLLEDYEYGSDEVSDEIKQWLSLRTLIIEKIN